MVSGWLFESCLFIAQEMPQLFTLHMQRAKHSKISHRACNYRHAPYLWGGWVFCPENSPHPRILKTMDMRDALYLCSGPSGGKDNVCPQPLQGSECLQEANPPPPPELLNIENDVFMPLDGFLIPAEATESLQRWGKHSSPCHQRVWRGGVSKSVDNWNSGYKCRHPHTSPCIACHHYALCTVIQQIISLQTVPTPRPILHLLEANSCPQNDFNRNRVELVCKGIWARICFARQVCYVAWDGHVLKYVAECQAEATMVW